MGFAVIRLFSTLAVICLLSDIAQAAPASQSPRTLAVFSVKSLAAMDGSTLTLEPGAHGLLRTVAADGTDKKTIFRLLHDRLGTVSDTDGTEHVVGLFLLGERSIATEYTDGRSEVMILGEAGGASIALESPGGDAVCTSWYPAGHRFSITERKAELAAYARRLGINDPRYASLARASTDSCLAAMKKSELALRPKDDRVPEPPVGAGSDTLNAITAQVLALYARKQPAFGSQYDPSDGFEDFYVNFLAAHEGGYTANDGNGSPANFGVNQGANPDIDVLAMSQADAKQLLHDRYWVASGADRLPPGLAVIHGDTAINLGVRTANELLALSGGDPDTYLALRDQKYRAIAEANPDKARYLPLWLARNQDLRNFGGVSARNEPLVDDQVDDLPDL